MAEMDPISYAKARRAEDVATTGVVAIPKETVLSQYDHFKDGFLFRVIGVVGKHLDDVPTFGSAAINVKIDVENWESITYPTFKTTENNGCFVVNADGEVLWAYAEKDAETGTLNTIVLPEGAKYFVLSISPTLAQMSWSIYRPTALRSALSKVVRDSSPVTIPKSAMAPYQFVTNKLLPATGVVGRDLGDILQQYQGQSGARLYKLDVSKYRSLTYPVFKSTSGFGSVFVDENDVVIWEHSETVETTGSMKEVLIPYGAKYFILGISRTLDELPWEITLYPTMSPRIADQMYTEVNRLVDDLGDSTADGNTFFTLCALKTDILDSKIPYHRGYLFHKMADDGSLWYGNDLDHIRKIGTVGFAPKDCVLAMSPTDGRVIATKRGTKGSLYVWDGVTTVELFPSGSAIRPKGWLYNSGVEFTKDGSGNEYCLFAEYAGSAGGQTGGFYVWRGVYPYTSEENWTTVFFQGYTGDGEPDGIAHFHQIRRDPWTGILYLTSGDANAECKWWYSLDHGATWTLLTTGPTSGLEEHACRLINFVFTKDAIYWATDHGTNHTLNKVVRDGSTGIIDVTTRVKLSDLPAGRATNSICYVDRPHGLFMFDRVDIGFSDYYDDGFDVQFWSFDSNSLETVMHIDLRTPDWGGHRGKCYTNYTSGREPRPAMGFSVDTKCDFDIVAPDPSAIGTVFYEIQNGVLRYR